MADPWDTRIQIRKFEEIWILSLLRPPQSRTSFSNPFKISMRWCFPLKLVVSFLKNWFDWKCPRTFILQEITLSALCKLLDKRIHLLSEPLLLNPLMVCHWRWRWRRVQRALMSPHLSAIHGAELVEVCGTQLLSAWEMYCLERGSQFAGGFFRIYLVLDCRLSCKIGQIQLSRRGRLHGQHRHNWRRGA